MKLQLPIDELLPDLKNKLADARQAVLIAEPGAGKTMRVPLAMLDEPWLAGKKVLLLEPRRLAARAAAEFMAKQLGQQAGELVGYRVRLDSRISKQTRLEVVTEGVLTRLLNDDPALEEYGLIIFDEFHERHLDGDLGLALCLQVRQLLREDLRLLVMSATLEGAEVASLLGGAPVLQSSGRTFPVELRYYPQSQPRKWHVADDLGQMIGSAIHRALAAHSGDLLVFLPGVGEIRMIASWLQRQTDPLADRRVVVKELHGNLSLDKQAEAILPTEQGERKIVLATSIAESSLTVEGITVVIDSGLARKPHFSVRTGMTRLETRPIAQSSAKQRAGRAGRLQSGVCYRLWTEEQQGQLAPFDEPEMLHTDLSSLALSLYAWGIHDPQELDWLTPPPRGAYEQGAQLLKLLGAIDEESKLTQEGRSIAALGISVRLGAMLLAGKRLGWTTEACLLAALLSERDLLHSERQASLALRLRLLIRGELLEPKYQASVYRLRQQAKQWQRRLEEDSPPQQGNGQLLLKPIEAGSRGSLSSSPKPTDLVEIAGTLLLFAYPDRIAKRRPDGRYQLSNGRGALLPAGDHLAGSEWLVATEVEDAGQDGRIRMATSVAFSDIERHMPSGIKSQIAVRWDADLQLVRVQEQVLLGAIVVQERPLQTLAEKHQEQVAECLLQALLESKLELLPWSKHARQLLARMQLLSQANTSDFVDASLPALLESTDEWLRPHLYGLRSKQDLTRLNVPDLLQQRLSWSQQQLLQLEVPTHFQVPSGSRIAIDYSEPAMPKVSVRLQEVFGLQNTPRLAMGSLALTMELLSPAGRPVQITSDLASFWRQGYFEVKKDLKGRYPKHYWPDNPLEAEATRRVRPKKATE